MNDPVIYIPVSPGEVLDRLSILCIKVQKLAGYSQEIAVQLYSTLHAIGDQLLNRPGVSDLYEKLQEINGRLWEVEDELRGLDQAVFPYGTCHNVTAVAGFCELARGVYKLNDKRSAVKREIDELFGSTPEPKQYTKYEGNDERRDSPEEDRQEEDQEAQAGDGSGG